jgi:hypothetical protein
MSRFHCAAMRGDLHPAAPQVDINADSGVIQARRIIDRLHVEEQVAAAA